ncbi:hypothetical protein AKJ09_02745 [Labilithrix luteola]|uniref:Uncharacterized protein n=1 Tax=Labilithrix luteola TaxID=1391654 RepID=A0A0K1PRR1_9BACT|nr:hypothetical protein AKJ09_02745 [Labilithrix luteola]
MAGRKDYGRNDGQQHVARQESRTRTLDAGRHGWQSSLATSSIQPSVG